MYLERAKVWRERGDLPAARQDCTVVIERYPQSAADAYSQRGACYRDEKDFPKAIKDLDEAIRLAPHNPLAYSRRGFCYLKLKKLDKALEDLNEAIELKPDDVDRLNRGIVYSLTGQSAPAISEFNSLIATDPTNSEAFYQRGLVRVDQIQYGKAIADFRATLKLEPKYDNALASLALLLACGPGATIETAQEAVRLASESCVLSNRQDAMHLDALAAALAKMGDFKKAVETAETAVELAKGTEKESDYKERLALYRKQKPFNLPTTGPSTRE